MTKIVAIVLLAAGTAWAADATTRQDPSSPPATTRQGTAAVAERRPSNPVAEAILKSSGFRAGVCVHVGCADGVLTARLMGQGAFVVHGLDRDEQRIEEARKNIQALGVYGRVSVERHDYAKLPYADNLINLLLVHDAARVLKDGLDLKEVFRVLTPNGVAFIGQAEGTGGAFAEGALEKHLTGAGFADVAVVREKGTWCRAKKPWPVEMDDWPQARHGADGNEVCKDTVLGPPGRLQWVIGPTWSRAHDGVPPSLVAMVSGGGRLYYVYDEAPPHVQGPGRWALIARDAFNGLLLWKRPLPKFAVLDQNSSIGAMKPNLLVAGERVYTILEPKGPLAALDAATGETVKIYEDAGVPSEVVYHDGALIMYERGEEGAKGLIRCVDAVTGKVRWQARDDAKDIVVGGGHVVFKSGPDLASLDFATGATGWRAQPANPHASLLAYRDDVLLLGSGWAAKAIFAHSAKTGEALWTHEFKQQFRAIGWTRFFCIGDLIWVSLGKGKDYVAAAIDLKTGEEKQRFDFPAAYKTLTEHGRCYASRATSRYMITSLANIDFVDMQDRNVVDTKFVRGICGYGALPCNGLLYIPPHPCQCRSETRFRGFMAVAAQGPTSDPVDPAAPERIERCAAAENVTTTLENAGDDWTTYRHDALRSGSTTAEVSAELKLLWTTPVGEQPTPPVAAGGAVLVASTLRHQVSALDAATGQLRWTFTAGGPVDTPPTVFASLVLFGCRDGWVYCLRASDGQMVWRSRAAPQDRRVIDRGMLESAWPVSGSVLLSGGVAYFSAGRSSFLDGGIYVYAADPKTGRILWQKKADNLGINDVMVSGRELVYVRSAGFDPKTGENRDSPRDDYLHTGSGMLDDSWPSRAHWSRTGAKGSDSELLVFRGDVSYGVRAFARYDWNSLLKYGNMPAAGRDSYTVFRSGGAGNWKIQVKVRPRGILLAGDLLVVAGTPDISSSDDPWGAFEGRAGGALWILSAADGKTVARIELKSPPVYDGMAAAGGRLYISTQDGNVCCLARDESKH